MDRNSNDPLDTAAKSMSEAAGSITDKAHDAVESGKDSLKSLADGAAEKIDDLGLRTLPERAWDFFRTQQREHPGLVLLISISTAAALAAIAARSTKR